MELKSSEELYPGWEDANKTIDKINNMFAVSIQCGGCTDISFFPQGIDSIVPMKYQYQVHNRTLAFNKWLIMQLKIGHFWHLPNLGYSGAVAKIILNKIKSYEKENHLDISKLYKTVMGVWSGPDFVPLPESLTRFIKLYEIER